MHIKKNTALILVDLQNDFFEGGALAVPKASAIFPLANDLQTYFSLVIATQDWHPLNHQSFLNQHPGHSLYDVVELKGGSQIIWPTHCVQGSKGAEFHPALNQNHIHKIIHKGTDANIDSYSTFFDNAHQKSTGLETYLKEQGITEVFIMGLATDYCVLYSVLDATKLGFKTYVITDGCFGLDEKPGDVDRAFQQMRQASAILIKSDTIQHQS